MFGFKFLGNTHIPHNKNTADMTPIDMTPPKEVVLPTSQHIGAPAIPIVKVGDEVKVGQLIAEQNGYVSSPVHASVSGKVVKIEGYLLPDGREVPAIRIESDGLMTVSEEVRPPVVNDLDSLIEAVKASGLVGLGGAGFPTAVKLDGAKKGAIHTIVINAAECEPYITSDMRMMLDHPELVYEGISILAKCIPSVKKFVIAIEDNKPECIKEMARIFQDNPAVSVFALPALYPQGAEKVVIKNTTGLTVPEGKIPADVGVIVLNVTTLSTLAEYVKTGMPLVKKCVTVDGSAVKEPKNLIIPMGTSIADVIKFMNIDMDKVGKVLYGGPMMGIALSSLEEPVAKRNNAITIMSPEDARVREATACIHCGKCVSACPMKLNPTIFTRALALPGTADKVAALEEGGITLCMECGCCSFVCPANRPLMQNNRLAKIEVRTHKSSK